MYTFGAPRVGNSEYARFFDGLGIEAFRIVNGQDIVARMPRHANSAGRAKRERANVCKEVRTKAWN
jgi:predicted lipase